MINGYVIVQFPLGDEIKQIVINKDWDQLDSKFQELTSKDGSLFKTLREYEEFNDIEFIISLRESHNEWEEDGIWHDDGSRLLAFSLSLTLDSPEGGVLEFRKKGSAESNKIETPEYGQMIIFKTGVSGYEHKINAVTKGQRLIIAGWCT